MHAGFRSPSAPIIYRAIQLAALAGFPALVALGCALLARPLNSALLYILFAFVVGFFLPRYVLRTNDSLASATGALGPRRCAGPDGHLG